MNTSSWYVVYTKPKCELKVANALTRKHIRNFCPLQSVENQLLDSRRTILAPLFTSFVFVNINEAEKADVLNLPGVLNFLYWLNKPVTVDEDEIGQIMKLASENNNLKLEKCLIRHNESNGNPGYDCETPGEPASSENLRVLLPSLGYCITAYTSFA